MGWVELNGVRKTFGGVEVIHGVDLDIAEGEFVALVGPSGCGKSTLLRMIAGLEEVTGGEISIGGEVVNDLSPRDRNIAMVFQSYALYPHMTVAENMGFNLKLSGMSKASQKPLIDEAARMLDLTALLDRRPAQLSGGQRQRVAMGRAVVRDPSVFLFDEPLSNLDAKLRVQMRAEIKMLHKKVGRTAIYVTHDQIEAMTLADRVVVLNGGKIEQEGSPMELYLRPANTFVAGFIGSPAMNLLDATARRSGEAVTAVMSDGSALPLPAGLAVTDGQAIKVGLRPEHLNPAGTGGGSLAGPVVLTELTGAQAHIVFRYAGHELTAVIDSMQAPEPNGNFTARIAADQIHVFDGASGRSLRA
ncbi:ABC transporter [Devosia riboflavina]|uniref:ABC transporter n=1 Tax=Devosia riboflavina TaxID=46914 RepID=A0A087M5P1_9HYPH|nr:sn-glycerol-3-phosphate ABC transporter ATP-binding protein UgpC [Devosia riboflavina]KFL32194.1 ABC transporter [Devosia riboflavina]